MYKPKWIQLASPQVALNSPDVKRFIMKYSPVIPWDKNAHEILGKYVPANAKHVIFNCHGTLGTKSWPGIPSLTLGQVFHPGNVSAFELLYPIDTLRVIWISACNLSGSSTGLEFCKEMARRSGCFVVAHTMAVPDAVVRSNCIEDYRSSMPQYIDPFGDMVSRDDFFGKIGPLMGFSLI
jgi:hypothetical protein